MRAHTTDTGSHARVGGVWPKMGSDLTDELDDLATQGETWGLAVSAHLIEHPDPVVAHAATMIGSAIAGIRRAIVKANERDERAAARLARREAEKDTRTYDKLTIELAEQRGITPAAMQVIRDEAAVRSRKAASRGSISDQMAKLNDG